jgi:hypothetical protein
MQARFRSCASPKVSTWLLTHPTTPIFHLSPSHFLTTLCTCFGFLHLLISHLSWCQWGHTIDNLGTHLVWCPCRNEHIVAHDPLWDIVITIILESGTHVQKEVSHLFPYHIQQRMDILITKNNLCTLMDVIIVDLTCTNMVQRTLTTTTHVVMMVV